MKKSIVLIVFNCLLCVPAFAQTRSRVFDNFDTSRGIEIVTPSIVKTPVAAKPPVKTSDKNLVKKTALVRASGRDAAGLKTFTSQRNPQAKLMMSLGASLDSFTTGDAVIDSYIVDSCLRNGIDPLLIYSQMHQESSFKLKATSNKGARGLMQLMPATAIRFGVTDIYNPKQNIEAGVKYMRWLMDTFGNDVNLALAGYNAGEGAVMKYGNQIPPYSETQEYVRRISERYMSIRNPNTVKAVKIPTAQLAKLETKESAPLTIYERNALTIKLPDGRMRLVNQ
ncbi:MAG: lytic transglycosylase domain-containing protein [Pyrinomonadaceae bacterium]